MLDSTARAGELRNLRDAARAELRGNILPFWERYAFDEDGFLVAEVTDDGEVRDHGPRHTVLIARILWTFATAAIAEPADADRWLATARRALALLTGPCWDDEHGGVYWALGDDGDVESDRKQVYAQAFAIYGLAAYYAATGAEDARARAMALFDLLETHSRDREFGGYVEAHARDWGELDDTRLSERDLKSQKSMNTMLHVLEAYTTLARVTGDARVREALAGALSACLDHVYRAEPFPHCELFFDRDWTSIADLVSYGHDIEAAWLMTDAAATVGRPGLEAATQDVAIGLANAVAERGHDADGGVVSLGTYDEVTEQAKEWWPQAEGVVGWLDAFELTGDEANLDHALRTWGFIERHVIDREVGEWRGTLDRAGNPVTGRSNSLRIGPWKCPYHNARACIEIMRRVPA